VLRCGCAFRVQFVEYDTSYAFTYYAVGTHTVYLRNDNLTRTLVADVYRTGRVAGSLDLRAGPVGIALPLRGVAQTAFQCSLEPAGERSIHVHPPQHVPDLLEFAELPGRGYLLTSVFTLPVQNLQSNALTVEFTVSKPLGQDGEFYVREAKPLHDRAHGTVEYGYPGEIAIAPGQTLYLALDLIPHYASNTTMPFLSCRKNKQFQITVIPSRGSSVVVPIEFGCRRVDQSFSVSYLDHDHSVSQAAMVFPLEYHSPQHRTTPAESVASSDAVPVYPVLLTMHGSGIAASNHADAHKVMYPGQSAYTFGVEGYFVVAPSRFGAHNWEHTGELSAMQAIRSLKVILSNTVDLLKLTPKSTAKASVARTTLPLPQVRLGSAIASGHSMGAHGAWMVALNHPDCFSCLAPLSGWINKEEYGTANAFLLLDGSSAHVDPQLREVLQSAMSDTHADKLMRNVQGMDVYLRVGSADATTHPWYTRRMHRLLLEAGVNSTYTELPDKQHWWWDTDTANDGGVLNDPAVRDFYAHCRTRANPLPAAGGVAAFHPAAEKAGCRRNISLTVVNPATHSGLCGLRVLQQRRIVSRTSAHLSCSAGPARNCNLVTHNVQKLEVKLGASAALSGDETLHVGLSSFDLSHYTHDAGVIELCWTKASTNTPVLCSSLPPATSPVHQKSLVNYGPARQVAARPFCIVYGTPKSQALRLVLRDLAVYIANSHAAAYGTQVRVMTDLDYIASKVTTRPSLANIMFIGGPTSNRLMSMICGYNSSSSAANSTLNTLPLACRIPHSVDFSNAGFSLDGDDFNDPKQSVLFTLPFYRPGTTELGTFAGFSANRGRGSTVPAVTEAVGMALCLHGNSLAAYLHLSRLAWPVVPPMVRAPLETYIPDYMVLSEEIWAKGLGAVLKAGYWDNDWHPSADQAYSNERVKF
jgi:hypothetical protein